MPIKYKKYYGLKPFHTAGLTKAFNSIRLTRKILNESQFCRVFEGIVLNTIEISSIDYFNYFFDLQNNVLVFLTKTGNVILYNLSNHKIESKTKLYNYIQDNPLSENDFRVQVNEDYIGLVSANYKNSQVLVTRGDEYLYIYNYMIDELIVKHLPANIDNHYEYSEHCWLQKNDLYLITLSIDNIFNPYSQAASHEKICFKLYDNDTFNLLRKYRCELPIDPVNTFVLGDLIYTIIEPGAEYYSGKLLIYSLFNSYQFKYLSVFETNDWIDSFIIINYSLAVCNSEEQIAIADLYLERVVKRIDFPVKIQKMTISRCSRFLSLVLQNGFLLIYETTYFELLKKLQLSHIISDDSKYSVPYKNILFVDYPYIYYGDKNYLFKLK